MTVVASLRLAALVALSLFAAAPAAFSAAQATRLDPYKNFKFKLELDGRYVAGLNSLALPTEVVEHRSGGDPSTAHKSPGRSKYDAITLDRGLTVDPAFHAWASSGPPHRGAAPPDGALREVRIVAFDGAARPVAAYRIHRAWVSEYQALPDLDAGGNAIAIQHIRLENEGWERDVSLIEPPQPR